MKNKLALMAGTLAILTLPLTSFAVEAGVSAEAKVRLKATTSSEARIKAKLELDERRAELEEKKEEFKKQMELKREEVKANYEDKKEDLEQRREGIKNKIEDRKDAAVENIRERLQKFTENVVERYNAAIERLEKLSERIDSRISKLETEGVDVTKAKELSAVSKVKIETAKTSVAAIKIDSDMALYASSSSSSTPSYKEGFEKLRIQLEKAKGDIKEAHASLVDIIENLKPGLNKKATTTPTTSTSTATSTSN